MQELGHTAADIRTLRTELDELLRARQYAAQRERRLAEAVRAASEPDRTHGYAQPQQQPDPELLRRLAQARSLREGLGARCLELSERLLALEDLVRQNGGAVRPDHREPYDQGGGGQQDAVPRQQTAGSRPADVPNRPRAQAPAPPDAPAPVPAAPAAPAKRRRPTGARFGGAFQEEPLQTAGPDTAAAAAAPAPVRGARFGGVRAPEAADEAERPAPAGGEEAAPAAPAPPPRSAEELAAFAARITDLHGRGAAHESAAVAAQAAVTLAPQDVAALAGLLRARGPYGAAGYLVRATAHGSPDQAAGTLAELRRTGLADEANELFHALWAVPGSALPALLAALERAGQAADGQTLLWEWASAPPAELAALAGALATAGRAGDVRHLLRQAAGRPVADVAAAVRQLAFPADPHPSAAQLAALLVREAAGLRSPGDLAELGRALLPHRELYQVLLGAAVVLEEGRSRGVLAALRAAGLPTEPPAARSRGRR
ncbi:hypothetical protein BX265_4772 [Streptomyces sp. TLI_235]|nr:hypothetical protein BX265_4772 [Streptomyces sp. TLI_235]